MNKFGLVIHGGASEETPQIKNNANEIKQGLDDALQVGYKVLENGGTAVDAVQAAVQSLEDNELFNAGRGSALNCVGEVEMDASIMDGKSLKAGAVAIVRNIKNPIVLARAVMDKTSHVFLSAAGALQLAKSNEIVFEPKEYFVTDYQYQQYQVYVKEQLTIAEIAKKKQRGTVGAVALDQHGNIASATSTGGTSYSLEGRIGDSCVIGGGCYANNDSCAVSGTGEGEVLIRNVVGHSIAMLVEYSNYELQRACDFIVIDRHTPAKGEIGVISINRECDVGVSFNCELMKRAWMTSDGQKQIKIYRD